jgi:WD40 repeat protein
VDRLEFDATGTLLLSLSAADRDRKVKLWDVTSGRLLATHAEAGTDCLDARFGPDGRLLAITAGGKTATLDVGGLEEQTLLTGPTGTVRALAFSGDGRWLTGVADHGAGGAGTAAPRELCWWEPAATSGPRRVAPLEAAGEGRSSVALAPGGDLLACSGSSGLLLVDLAEGRERGRLAAREATSPFFGRDGRRLWAVVEGNTLQSWDLPQGQPATRWRNGTSEVLSGLGGLSCCAAGDEWVLAGGRDGAPPDVARRRRAAALRRPERRPEAGGVGNAEGRGARRPRPLGGSSVPGGRPPGCGGVSGVQRRRGPAGDGVARPDRGLVGA